MEVSQNEHLYKNPNLFHRCVCRCHTPLGHQWAHNGAHSLTARFMGPTRGGGGGGLIWGRQYPDEPHVGTMNFAIWDYKVRLFFSNIVGHHDLITFRPPGRIIQNGRRNIMKSHRTSSVKIRREHIYIPCCPMTDGEIVILYISN